MRFGNLVIVVSFCVYLKDILVVIYGIPDVLGMFGWQTNRVSTQRFLIKLL